MSGLLRSVVAIALGAGLSAPLYAVEGETTQPYADYQTALKRCDNLPETARARCIVNIRRTQPVAYSVAGSEANTTTVRDDPEADRVAAERECQAVMDNADRQRCIANAKDHFGRM